MTKVQHAYDLAQEQFALLGVDTEHAMQTMAQLPVSIHCWQGDDVAGFENPEGPLTGGIHATGNYPGKARNATELRADLEKAFSLIPGPKRLNLNALYLESEQAVECNDLQAKHFSNCVNWAKEQHLALYFNPSVFSQPVSNDGTLSPADDKIRRYWIEHG